MLSHTEQMDEIGSSDEIDKLERWTLSGAQWRVLQRTAGQVTIAMITCTGGEEVDRFTSSDAALLGWLGERHSSEDD